MQPMSFTCTRCGAPLPPGVSACPNCGLTFSAPVPAGPMPGYGAPPPKKSSSVGLIIGLVVGLFGLVFVIAILAAILFPVFAQAREKARLISSEANLRQIGLATIQYAQDHNEQFPPMGSMDAFKAALSPYVKQQPGEPDLFVEPFYNQPYVLNTKMSKKNFAELNDPESVELAHEPVSHMGGMVATLYADGHVQVVQSTNQ